MNIKEVIKELSELRKNTENKYWNIGIKTAEYLQNTIIKNNYKNILEIGTSNGLSALYLIEALLTNNGKLMAIESNNNRFYEAKNNFTKAGVEKHITFLKGHSPEILDSIPETFDLIFIDCAKTDYLNTYKKVRSKISKNGIIICDNALSHEKELRYFIEYLSNEKNTEYKIIQLENGLIEINN